MNNTNNHNRLTIMSRFAFTLVIVGLILLLTAGAGFFFASQTTPGTRLVYRIDGDTAAAKDVVKPLQSRLDGVGGVRVKVQTQGSDEIEVIVASRDRATIDLTKQLIESAGVLQFLIVANRADHGSLLAAATNQSNADLADPLSRDVLDEDDSIIGRWVTAARENAADDDRRRLRVDISQAVIRNGDTGEIIVLPEEIRGTGAEVAIAQWMDEKGFTSLDVLTAVDKDLQVRGTDLAFAATQFDQNGYPAIAFTLTDAGADRFFALTTKNAPMGSRQRQLGIILDDQLLSAPNILAPIRKEGRITGNFTREEVDTIVRILKAGQLPVALNEGAVSETAVEVPSPLAELIP